MFRFTITELKYGAVSVRKTWRSFPSVLPQMCHLSQSVIGKMIVLRLDPVWSPGCHSPRINSNDGTVLPKFDPVWSPLIRSAKIIQPNAEPKLELSRLTNWITVLPKFNPVCSPQIRSAIIIQPNAMPKLKLPRLTIKWSPIMISALPLLLRKCCSVPLESKSVLPCNLGAQKNRLFEDMLVAQSRTNVLFILSNPIVGRGTENLLEFLKENYFVCTVIERKENI